MPFCCFCHEAVSYTCTNNERNTMCGHCPQEAGINNSNAGHKREYRLWDRHVCPCHSKFFLLVLHIGEAWSSEHGLKFVNFLKFPLTAMYLMCYLICDASSKFVSSSIPSWHILTAHAQPIRGARDLAFCLKVPLNSLFLWASSGGSGETARMRRLAWTFAARIGDKYQIRLTRLICPHGLQSLLELE